MLVKKYRAEVISITNKIEEIYTLEFKSLDGHFKYHPGQFLHLAIDSEYDGTGQWPESRCFSMQSNPDEENIKITYSVKGRFTKQMASMIKIGTVVWLKMPYGDLFLQNHCTENCVFIAGGTGVTPFLSLFTHHSFKNYNNPKIYLGFKSKSYNVYLTTLESLNCSLPIIYYQNCDGIIDINLVHNENGNNCYYFISGPAEMIITLRQQLLSLGVCLDHILTDSWV